MIQNTFIVGGESKYATKFIERLNKRFGDELTLNIKAQKTWDQNSSSSEHIPSGTDLVLVMKSNVNHSLRNWAKKRASEQKIKFIECCHKTAIAEFDIRHCYSLSVAPLYLESDPMEEKDLYESWSDLIGEYHFLLPLWGEEDCDGLFLGADAYERMPWVREGKKKMISKWDRIWVSLNKQLSDETREIMNRIVAQGGRQAAVKPFHSLNNGKSPYYKLISLFKSKHPNTLGYTQVKLWADQWLKDAYLGTNFKDFSGKRNIDYALTTIFGVGLNDLSLELQEVVVEHYQSKRKRKPKKSLVKVSESIDTPISEPISEPISAPTVVVSEPIDLVKDYIMLGDLRITPNNTNILLDEVHLNINQISIVGEVHLSITRIESSVLYGVEIKRKGT
jgi:hypothetical protein